jgi:UDP-N-acetylglucosamine diphosphorylase / glucose-1-phosphate thymidylyltransferase / UDP-N-acetylgalactosamine diphosphorylase / glucosamine-1-phosphate N-acetyltransferase / galactosamine-1-phosphate N-acetyltransferase
MRVAFFEDAGAASFHPLTLARPVFDLVCGRYSLRERIVRHCAATEWGVFLRDHLAETYREAHPEARVNDYDWLSRGSTIVVNGRWLPTADAIRNDLQQKRSAVVNGRVAFMTLEPGDATVAMSDGWDSALVALAQKGRSVPARGVFLEHVWDLVTHNATLLAEDFRLAGGPGQRFEPGPQVATIGPREMLHVDPSARIEPFVVLDASPGPITIGPGVVLKPFTHITGPCHIDRGAQLFGACVRGATTIGPDCRVGGEIEASILHSHVNKYHAGFLGHSYICPWVNLGALTTNSDLKNDYSHIRVPVMGESVETGLTKIGCFIADHAKTSIGSLLNTGASIGAMSMILPDGQLSPKHVPSFCKAAHGELAEGIDLERALRTARIAMGRRNCELTLAQERLWRRLYLQTRAERENAILRYRDHDFRGESGFPQAKAG